VLGSSAEQFRIAAARRFSEGDVEPADGEYSSSLVRRVLTTREPILTTNVQDDARYELTQSILIQNIRSVLAVPMLVRGELQGAIYVDTRLNLRPFSDAHLRLLQAMANQAAMAIRNAKLHEDIKRRNEELERALCELRETQSQLVQAERLAAVGSLAANVAHELRNPLMVMRNATYFIDRLVSDGKIESPEIIKRYAAKIDSEIDRQTKIINDLLFFSRNRPRKLVAVDLNAILEETLMRVQMPESITIVKQLDASLETVQGDADQLQQVFVNLVTNAVQAMPDGGTLTVRTSSEQGVAQAVVQDTGVGMSPEHLARLFEPFFSTKQKGIGLGLAVTRSIVEAHRGRISVSSQEGQGTTFTVQLCHELVG
jgi:two-component system NtrC family sensor kinase